LALPSLPPEIRAVSNALADLRAPWAVAGGWAIDLALGRVTRPHADVDVAVFRDDQAALRAALPGWRFSVAVAGALHPWEPDARLEPPVHEIHAQPPTGRAPPALELLLNEQDGADWIYRRDPVVRRPLERVLRAGPGGVPVLAPEVVLLYKSKSPRPKDLLDLRAAVDRLDAESTKWLRTAIERAHPESPFLAGDAIPRA
jgi:hypothetical protein